MPTTEFQCLPRNGRYEVAFCIAALAFWIGVLIWIIPTLSLPHIHGNLNNLFGVGLLIVSAIAMLLAFSFAIFRTLYEIKSVVVNDSEVKTTYLHIGVRRYPMPFAGQVKRNVRMIDVRSEKGFREAFLVHSGFAQR